ncbi:hypothetical protein J7J58_07035 [candidate division WOR-3 bacterium]|nr:hypothetical protein [candidate division WOR-3 bacterium]
MKRFVFFTLLILFSFHLFGFPAKSVTVLNNRDYLPYTINLIKNAGKTIDVAMLEIHPSLNREGDPITEILDALIYSHNRGVKVRVIVDASNFAKNSTRQNMDAVEYLTAHGVEALYDDLDTTTHAKMFIVDSTIVVLGSTNWSYYAMSQNDESSVAITSPEAARYYEEKFFTPILKRSTKELRIK